MRLNTKVRYGLRAMIEIAKQTNGNGLLQKQIASTQGISVKYLDHIVNDLKTSGLIVNYFGKGSGYVLTRKTTEITIYDIFRSFEPELAIVDCLCEVHACNKSNECPSKHYWLHLNQEIKNEMMQFTLADIMELNNKPSTNQNLKIL